VSDDGTVHDVAQLKPIYPQGCALFPADVEQWPLAGDDLPGDLIVGESSYAGFARRKVQGISALDEHDVETEYPELAQAALSGGVVGSSLVANFRSSRRFEPTTRRRGTQSSNFPEMTTRPRYGDGRICSFCEAIASVTITSGLPPPTAASTRFLVS
jgi:hypothetical protein